jgi:hypothetical protein
MLLEQVQSCDTHVNRPWQHKDAELEKIAMVEETNTVINPRWQTVKENTTQAEESKDVQNKDL